MGGCCECDCALRIFLNQDADMGHFRRRAVAAVDVEDPFRILRVRRRFKACSAASAGPVWVL